MWFKETNLATFLFKKKQTQCHSDALSKSIRKIEVTEPTLWLKQFDLYKYSSLKNCVVHCVYVKLTDLID